MPIISKIGRKHIKVRLLFLGMYAFLILGATTMVYPFLLMVSGSAKSGVDTKYFNVIPRFLYDDTWLYHKHMEGLFNESVLNLCVAYDTDDVTFETVDPPKDYNPALAAEFGEFLERRTLPFYARIGGSMLTPVSKTMPYGLREFKKWLVERYGNDINVVNKSIGAEFVGWNSVFVRRQGYLMRRDKPSDTQFIRTLSEFYHKKLPDALCYYVSPEGFYRKLFLKIRYSTDIEQYNMAHETDYESYEDVLLPETYPTEAPASVRMDWEEFVMNTLALHWLKVDDSALPEYQAFLEAKYDSIEVLNRYYETAYKNFNEIPMLKELPFSGIVLSDWESFFAGWRSPDSDREYRVPVSAVHIHSPDFMFRNFLLEKHGSLEAVNKALNTNYSDPLEIKMPQRDFHYSWLLENSAFMRREFATRNYKTVAQYLVFRGRGIINTVIYTSLAVLAAILINPIAAYAMSRYKMPSTYKILLFLLCTMAFPPMVTQIPNFLMLRRLGLLNTFAALILPGMANGYSIFLLKGFFDAQPRELYESASLDGASEWVMFWQLTMSLSKPILAVIALSAFTAAYSNFMLAFVICQDERMWTLMVWIYQLQQRSGQAVVYASLIIAAIPTFLIFLFCQNIIMRGIVVPSEK